MLNPSLRRLMRHIALGAPLVLGAPLIACDGGSGMPDGSTEGGWEGYCEEGTTFTLYRDRLATDAGTLDSGMPDSGVLDSGVLDAGMRDAGVSDAAMPDGGASDAGTPDAGTPDAAAPDAAAPDAAAADGGGEDGGMADGGAGFGLPGPTDCWTLCSQNLNSGTYAPVGAISGSQISGCVDVDDNEITCETSGPCYAAGRPPFAAVEGTVEGRGTSSFFRELATAELASAPAFMQLAAALEAHGAPADLVQRALESADDEVRHAAIAARLGELDRVSVKTQEPAVPSLWALAVHNAETGCVGEAYGALEAAYMASHAERADVRAAFGSIARDEARHAMLSLDIDAWVRPLLGAAERAALDEATRRARAELPGKLAERRTPSELGLPGPEARAALLTQLAA